MPGDRPDLNRFREGTDSNKEAQIQLEAGRVVARQGAFVEARRMFRAAAEADPNCTEAWLQLAWLASDPNERKMFLRRVLILEPNHAQAQAELEKMERSPQTGDKEPPPAGRRGHPWLLVVLVLVAGLILSAVLIWGPVDSSLAWLLPTPTPTAIPTPTLTPAQVVLQFVPQLETALDAGQWQRALEIVAIMQGVDPAGEEVQHWDRVTHMRYGKNLVREGEIARALEQFDGAVAAAPQNAAAHRWQQVSQDYLAGEEALAAGQWPAAIQALGQAHEQLPEFGDLADRLLEAYVRQGQAALEEKDWNTAIDSLSEGQQRLDSNPELTGLLATAYRARGIQRQAEGRLQKARTDLETALALRPDDVEAQAHYDEVMYILFPPKRIEINLTTQQFYAWEGDTLIYHFATSTGLRGRDTAAGHYEVLDKIPMAYSSVWNLQMPYWLGIYYVGNIENGIHALPIRPDGSVMWGGLLGQRASYGCIILSTEAARLVYNWAEIGTEVHIHY
jgi:tetratricopeptide (TPR) repeat protein